MATIRSGNQAALLVVDVQAGVVAGAWQRDERVANVALAVRRAREAGVPVIWVQHNDDELKLGSPEWQWVPELVPADGELHIHKRHNSSFEQTELDAVLAAGGIAHLVLAGAASNWCIRATAYAALERGYDLTLLEDAHLTGTMELDGRRVEAQSVIDDLNIAMRWLSYPGRRNGCASAAGVAFSAAA
jgi:nicotinamidase-related amidase